jgi:hypothetical protein
MRDDDATWPDFGAFEDSTEPMLAARTVEFVRPMRAAPRFPLGVVLGAFVVTTVLAAAGTVVFESARAAPPPCPTTQPAQ